MAGGGGGGGGGKRGEGEGGRENVVYDRHAVAATSVVMRLPTTTPRAPWCANWQIGLNFSCEDLPLP